MTTNVKIVVTLWLAGILAILMTIASYSMFAYNDYMTYRDTPVTFVDKFTTDSCHKGHCRDRYIGLFKTTEGIVFDRPISAYMYRQMHLGEQFALNIRPFDIRQNDSDNAIWFFGPIIVAGLALIAWSVFLSELSAYFEPEVETPYH